MTTATATCEAFTRQRIAGTHGFDLARCHSTVGLTTWTDVAGKEHAACVRHEGGMKRRYPSDLPERTAPSGTLGLGTPWTRGKFAPADVIAVENAIPEGYRINVIARNPRSFAVIGQRETGVMRGRYPELEELFRSEWTADPLRVALAMCERLVLHDAETWAIPS